MKKIVALILSIIYISTSSGAVLNIKYCMEKVSAIEIEGLGKSDCMCGSKKTSKCCSSQYKVVKTQDNHTTTFTDLKIDPPVSIFVYPTIPNYFTIPVSDHKRLTKLSDTSPPQTSALPIYISNCVFRV